jgi:Pyruvate/2-oxoacid:ferredoxin oxidoreductase delta subunit
MSVDVYERLAQTFDAIPNGFTRTDSGVELKILRKIYTEEEAELTCDLKLVGEPAAQIADRLGREPESTARLLEQMRERGCIGSYGPPERRKYHLQPFVVGIFEYQLPRMDRELAELMEEYAQQGFFKGIGNSKPAFLHTVPVEHSIHPQLEIHPYESVRELMDKATAFYTVDCICRKGQVLLGQPCDKPISNCITMSMKEHAFDHNFMGRAVDREEAERIMQEAADAGLVHSTMNITDSMYHFCNCCPCCCGLLRGVLEFEAPHLVARSNFWATIDPDTCEACGVCADERCPMGAISEAEDFYQVDQERCLGCGVCVTTCPTESIELVRKPEDQCIQPPKNTRDWMIQRSEDTGKPLDRFL